MRLVLLFIACVLLAVCGRPAMGLADDGAPVVQDAEAARRYGLDPGSPLESRVRETSAPVMKMFKDIGAAPVAHALTEAERRQLSAAFAALPPLHRRVLSARLRGVSFLDGM